jgi:uncharacterized membrane protein
MSKIEKSIEVNAPVRTAYNQWTQFEEFPKFMEGVECVDQLDDSHLRWRAEIGGRTIEWDAEITEQIPDTDLERFKKFIEERGVETGAYRGTIPSRDHR